MDQVQKRRKDGYILLPYRLIRTCQTVLESLIAGTIWSFVSEDKVCNFGHKTFQNKLNVSKSTVSRKTKRIGDRADFTVQRNGGKASTYSTTFELDEGSFIDFPTWLAQPFVWDGQTIELTPSEQLILAMIYTYTKSDKASGAYRSFVGSPATIAQRLNDVVCARTVQASILRLEKLGLIERKKKAVNAHGAGLGEYVAVMARFRAIERAKKKAAKRKAWEEEKAKKKAENASQTQNKMNGYNERRIIDLNCKSERDHFYAQRKDANEAAAEKYETAAFKNFPRLAELTFEIKKMEPALGRAEHYGDVTLPVLLAKKKQLEEEKRALMRRNGIEEARFHAQAYVRCKLCNDTGYFKNGAYCDCWKLQRT